MSSTQRPAERGPRRLLVAAAAFVGGGGGRAEPVRICQAFISHVRIGPPLPVRRSLRSRAAKYLAAAALARRARRPGEGWMDGEAELGGAGLSFVGCVCRRRAALARRASRPPTRLSAAGPGPGAPPRSPPEPRHPERPPLERPPPTVRGFDQWSKFETLTSGQSLTGARPRRAPSARS